MTLLMNNKPVEHQQLPDSWFNHFNAPMGESSDGHYVYQFSEYGTVV